MTKNFTNTLPKATPQNAPENSITIHTQLDRKTGRKKEKKISGGFSGWRGKGEKRGFGTSLLSPLTGCSLHDFF